MDKKAQKPRSSAVTSILLVLLVLVCGSTIALSLWGIISASTRPAVTELEAAWAYLDALSVGDLKKINQDSGFSPSPLCSWRDYDEHLLELYGDFTGLTLSGARDGDNGLWEVRRGDIALGLIEVESTEGIDAWKVFTRIDEDYLPYTITTPKHLRVTVNGMPLSADDVMETKTAPGFDGIAENLRPELLTYQSPPLLSAPDIQATSEAGQAARVTLDDNARMAAVSLPARDIEAITEPVASAFVQYAAYLTGDADFDKLEPLLLADTALISRDEKPDERYQGLEIELTDVRDVLEWSEETLTATADYQITDPENEESSAVTASLVMSFAYSDGEWLIASILWLD